jgi:hypothetical protein
MVKTLVQNINRYPGCVAICANAFVIDGKDKTENLLSKSIALEPRVIRTPSTLARRYISEDYNVSPFPGYMYRSTVARECRKSMTAIGRVSDVSFLCTLLSHGGILQIGAPLLRYRLHAGQDTHNIALRNKVSLIRWFLAKGILKKSDPIVRYARLRNLVRSPKFPTKKDKTRMERRRFIAINSFFLFLISPQMLIRFCLNKIKKRLK